MVIVEEINILKEKLETQIKQKVSYDIIYDTSVKIDKLLVKYYDTKNLTKKV